MDNFSLVVQNLGFVLQTIIIFTATVIAAIWGNAFLRKKATIDYILNLQRDERLRTAKLRLLRTEGDEIEKHLAVASGADPIRDDLFYLLNCYEYFAVGIREKCFHERLAKKLNRSLIIMIWTKYEPMIDSLRKDKQIPSLYCELEAIVERWR